MNETFVAFLQQDEDKKFIEGALLHIAFAILKHSGTNLFDQGSVMVQIENSVLEMALIGYEVERRKIENAMAEIRSQLGVRSARPAAPAAAASAREVKPKRTMSAAGRKAISDATKKRWAEFHAAEKVGKPATKAAKPKRKMSRATKAKLTANLAKARAAKAAKKAQEPVPF